MSHAAMDFRSPITPSGVSPAIPVSQTNLGHPPATGSLNLASSTNGGFNCSNVSEKVTRSSRPKPRMVKIRKQSKMSESIGDGLGFDSFKLDPESLCRADRPAAASTHNVNGSFVFRGGSDDSGTVMNQGSKERSENVKQMGGNTFGNFHFVFSGNKSDSSSVNVEPAFGANQSKPISVSSAGIGGTVPEATRSSSVSNLKFENLANLHSNLEQKVSNNGERHSGTFEFGKFGGVASVFTANGSALQPNNLVSNEHSKSINPNNSFGANMSTSGLNFSFSNGEFGSNQKCSLKNLSSGKKESSVGGGTSVPEMNETAAFAFGSDYSFSTKNDFTGFVFGANLNNSSSFANTKAKEPFGKFQGGKADSEVESQKGNSSKVFVFRGNSEIGNLKCEESGKFDEDKHNSMNSKNAHIQDNHKFVFSSQGALDTDFHKSNVSKLSDEFNSMSFGADNNLCGKRHDNIQNVFVFGSNQTTFGFSTECGSAGMNFNNQHKNMNSRVPGNDDAVGKVEKTNVTGTGKSCTSGIDGKRASSLGVSTQNVAELLDKNTELVNCNEQINSWRSSAGIYGKENKPINLNDKISDGSQFCFQRDNGVDRNAFSIPSFSPEDTGIQLDGSSAVSPYVSKDEKNDEASFTSLPFGIGNIFTEFKASSSSEAFSFNVDLFSGSSKKIVYESSKSVRDKRSKKKKTLRQRNLMKKQVEPQNNESPDCASPMDFSPYQDTNSAPFAETSVAKKKCPGPSDNNLDVDSGNHLGDQKNDAFSTVPSSVDGLSRIRRQYKKKYKTKVCNRSNQINQQKPVSASPAFQFPPLGNNHSSELQRGATSSAQENGVHLFNTDEGHAKQEIPEYEACERWRIRGNQVYKGGDLYKAEDFYGKGIKSVSQSNIPECCIKPLLLCYSNRAATRMSLCRMREAINDCANAAALDPTFLKVKLRAGNCYLLLGEVQEAVQYYNSCLESRDVCLDRRITIEAAEGLQKAEKVAENLRQSAELLQQKTFDAARSALEIIAKALSISCYSEKLLEMKGEGLCKLRMYDEAIKLCEQTLDFAEKNFAHHNMENMNNSVKLWRWRIMSKSYYHLGKLEAALHLIEKQEQVFVKDGCGNSSQESSIPLGTTIRELLTRKKAGNEAFQSGKFAEALDHYNTAISCSVESLPFAAICFCNRAAAHQSLGQIIDAIADCSVAMALDENYTKAASRRATLHEMIRDYEHAVTDLQRLISLLENQEQEMDHQAGSQDRSNGSYLKELRKARQRLSSVEEKAKSEIPLDLYLILGIKASDPESDIKKAYKKAALKHHPDKAAQFLARSESMDDGQLWKDTCEKVQKDADRLFKMIGEAYAVLSDSDKRSKYNYEEEIRAARKHRQPMSSHMLPAQTQMLSDSLQRHPQQQTSGQTEEPTQQHAYQEAFPVSHDQLQQRPLSNIPSPSFSKTNFADTNSKFAPPVSPSSMQSMLGSLCPEGSSNLLNFKRTGQSALNEHQPQQSWLPKFANSHISTCSNSVSTPSYPGKEASSQQETCAVDAHNQSFFGASIDSPGLLLPTTLSSVTTSVVADVSSLPSGASGFQNSPYGYVQDSSELVSSAGQDDQSTPRTFVKVYKSGYVGRSLDITRISSYHELRQELAQMFGIEGLLEDPQRSGWQLVFVDRENDVLLLGDDPWEAFVNNVWYIKILSPEDVQKLGKQEAKSLSRNTIERMHGSGADGRDHLSGFPSLGSLEY